MADQRADRKTVTFQHGETTMTVILNTGHSKMRASCEGDHQTVGSDHHRAPLFIVAVLGNGSVGKTCFCDRLTSDAFSSHGTGPTIGLDVRMSHVATLRGPARVQLWDVGNVDPASHDDDDAFYRGVHGAFLLYDVARPASFASIQDWLARVDRTSPPHTRRMLIATKADELPQVSHDEAAAFAASFGLPFAITSSRDGTGVREALSMLVDAMWDVRSNSGACSGNFDNFGACRQNIERSTRQGYDDSEWYGGHTLPPQVRAKINTVPIDSPNPWLHDYRQRLLTADDGGSDEQQLQRELQQQRETADSKILLLEGERVWHTPQPEEEAYHLNRLQEGAYHSVTHLQEAGQHLSTPTSHPKAGGDQ